MKKRILMVVNSPLLNSGVPNVVMEIVRQLKEHYIFDLLQYSLEEGVYDEEFKSYGGNIFKVDLIDYSKHKLLYPYRYFQLKKIMNNILSEWKYDVVHCHNGIESGVCLECASKCGVPVRISHSHGSYTIKGKNILRLKYRVFCQKLTNIYSTIRVACSTKAGDALFEREYVNLLNPVNTEMYRYIKKTIHQGLELLQIGYFCSNKNQLHSLKLLKHMRSAGIDAYLNFIGFEQQTGYIDEMKSFIRKSGLEKYVRFLPSDVDKIKVFSVVDCAVIPSYAEGLPIVALECQVAGIPCILSENISGDADVGNAFFVKLNDFNGWTQKILYAVSRTCEEINIDFAKVDVKTYMLTIKNIYEMME